MKYEGVVVLFKPDDKMLDNINSYVNELSKLYVVDNTPDGDISEKFVGNKKIEYIPLKENKGIAYALNVGAKRALKDKADWLLTMDQDSKFSDGELNKMKKFIELCKKEKNMEPIIEAKYSNIGLVSPFHVTVRTEKEKRFGIESPLNVMTSGNLINLKAYKKVGGFKDWLFIDCVDFDFCLNLRNHGFQVLQLNFVKLQHELGNTKRIGIRSKVVYVDNHSAFRRYYIARNRHYLYDIYNKDFPEYCRLELKSTRSELIKIWLFEKHKIKKTRAIIRGYRDYKKGVKGSGNK